MPRSAAAQEEPEVSTPITLSDDVGGEVSLTLGLDPGATDGFDDAFGEERLPPFPPEPSSLVARFIDDDLNDGDGLEGFPNSGMPADIRQGSSSFTGTKVHEIRFETGDDATEITIEWDLPDGVTGTIEDKFGGDVYGPASMEGSGSLTISPGDPEAILTIEYEENQAPTIDTNAGLGVEEGGRASITTSELSASDPDNGASELTYQLTSGPSQGKLLVGVSQASSFTQADLESGDVEYNHTASSAGDDSFEFDLTDPSGAGPTGQTFQASVNAPPAVEIAPSDLEVAEGDSSVRLQGVSKTFRDPDGDELSFSASSDREPVVTAEVQESTTLVLDPQEAGTAEVTITASDAQSETPASFDVTVVAGEEASSAKVVATVGTSDHGSAVSLGDSGVDVALSNASGQGQLVLERFESPPSSPSGIEEANVSQYRIVLQARGVSVGTGTEVRLSAGKFGGIDDPSQVTVYRRATPGQGTFSALPTSVEGEVIVAETESFSEFALGSDTNPLPVELVSFNATAAGSEVQLTWQTASEQNNAGFQVQREQVQRETGRSSWKQVGYVKSKAADGTTSEGASYRHTVEDLPVGTHRFRLKQEDLDGSTTFTDPVTVHLRMRETVRLGPPSPNPTQGSSVLSFAVKEETKATVAVYNTLGQRVKTLYEGAPTAGESQRVRLGTEDLSSGTYFIRLEAGGKTRTRRLTVVR